MYKVDSNHDYQIACDTLVKYTDADIISTVMEVPNVVTCARYCDMHNHPSGDVRQQRRSQLCAATIFWPLAVGQAGWPYCMLLPTS